MKNVPVIMLALLFMFIVSSAEAQRGKKQPTKAPVNKNKKTARQPTKAPVHKNRTANPKIAKRNAKVPVKRVPVKRTRVVYYDYRHLPKRGAVVTTIDSRAGEIRYGNIGYRFYAGVWYKPLGNQWVVTRPSYGVRVQVLPVGYRRVLVGPRVYYYYYGTYYTQQNQEYEVIEAPMGAEVGSLPDGYNVLTVNGVEYYELDGIYYMPSVDENGTEILIVVERPVF